MPSAEQVARDLQSEILAQDGVISVTGRSGRIIISVTSQETVSRLQEQLGGSVGGYPVEFNLESEPQLQQKRPMGTPPLTQAADEGRGDRYRPTPGGVQTGVGTEEENYGWWGTLTGLWRDVETGEPVVLSNRHVWKTYEDQIPDGATITQPASERLQDDAIATLSENSEVTREDTIEMEVDTSLARLTTEDLAAPATLEGLVDDDVQLVDIRGVRQPEVGMEVTKFGARTGVSSGEVLSVEEPLKIPRENEDVIIGRTFKTSAGSQSGDSGSPYVNQEGELVGQLFAGTTTGDRSWGNTYEGIRDEFGVEPVIVSAGGEPTVPTRAATSNERALLGAVTAFGASMFAVAAVPER